MEHKKKSPDIMAKIRMSIQGCENCKILTDLDIRHHLTLIGWMDIVVQIDFRGPMKSGFQQKYACTMIGIHTAIGMALGKKNPDAKTTIRALARWCSHYGTPQITE